jgi:hypothetical protein
LFAFFVRLISPTVVSTNFAAGALQQLPCRRGRYDWAVVIIGWLVHPRAYHYGWASHVFDALLSLFITPKLSSLVVGVWELLRVWVL